jgi:hypothetical protein
MSPALLVYIQAHLDEDLSLDVLSAQASLSARVNARLQLNVTDIFLPVVGSR